MKKVLILLIVAISLSFSSIGLFAQKAGKIGHINIQELLDTIPGRDSAELKYQSMVEFQQQSIAKLNAQYEKEIGDYQALKSSNALPEIIQDKEQELMTLQQKIQEQQVQAQQKIQEFEAKLMKPLYEKATNTINAVAKEQGFAYIIDSSKGGAVLYSEGGEDIMPLVKAKLGIK